jgi:pyruvate dehydrogenase phosphatase
MSLRQAYTKDAVGKTLFIALSCYVTTYLSTKVNSDKSTNQHGNRNSIVGPHPLSSYFLTFHAPFLTNKFFANCDNSSPSSSWSSWLSWWSKSSSISRPLLTSSSSSYLSKKIGSYTYPANNPIEDRHIYGLSGESTDKKKSFTYSAVFDGHGGHQIADMASTKLMPYIFSSLANIDFTQENKGTLESMIKNQMKLAFDSMENEIVETVRPSFQLGHYNIAKVGSCVLVAIKKENHLIIANCGDCRAVLGSSRSSTDSSSSDSPSSPASTSSSISASTSSSSPLNNCYFTRLNREHNCRESFEQDILRKEHPNEPDLIRCKSSHACYVKGRLQLTRSLGDEYLKHAEFNGNPELGKAG